MALTTVTWKFCESICHTADSQSLRAGGISSSARTVIPPQSSCKGWTTGGAGAPDLVSSWDFGSFYLVLWARLCLCYLCEEGFFALCQVYFWLGRHGHFWPYKRLESSAIISFRTRLVSLRNVIL